MDWIRALIWLLPRRFRSSWVLLAVTSFGILAAVTLMGIGAIYSRALAEGGLRHNLAITSQVTMNAYVRLQNKPLESATYDSIRSTVEDISGLHLGFMLREYQRLGQARPNMPMVHTLDGSPPPSNSPFGQPFFLTDFQEHSRIIKGRWPESAPVLHSGGLDMEVVVGRWTAARFGWEPGSRAYLIPFREDPTQRIAVTIAGIAEPIFPVEEYWMYTSSVYFNVQEPDDETTIVPMYVPEEDFFSGLGARYPYLSGDFGWFLYLDTGVLTTSDVGPTKDAITGLERDINKLYPRSLVFTGLDNTLRDFERDLIHATVPLFLFISLVVLVILYFLYLVMGVLSRTLSDEVSLLRSRGATVLQVGGLLAVGEGALVLAAMLIGPFLALAIVHYLLLGTISPAGDGGPVSVGISADMFVMGAIGGALSLAVLAVSGMGLARLGVVEFFRARARPPSIPILHRYYVDLLLLAVLGVLWWQIDDREGFLTRNLLRGRELEIDHTILLGPATALLAASFLFLRVLPLLLWVIAWLGRRIGPGWVSFSLMRLARDPVPHGSLAILLMMAAALGIFGAAFQATLSRSQEEQALYEMGGDVVIRGSYYPSFIQDDLAETPGVLAVSPIDRGFVVAFGDGFPPTISQLLAIDPETLPGTAWFRDDFSRTSLADLFRPLETRDLLGSRGLLRQDPDTGEGIAIPTKAESVGIWVNVATLRQSIIRQRLSLWMHLAEGNGGFTSLFVGDLISAPEAPLTTGDEGALPGLPDTTLRSTSPEGMGTGDGAVPGQADALGQVSTGEPDWIFLEVSLMGEQSYFTPQPPLSIVSIFMSGDSISSMPPASIDLDDITVKVPSGPEGGRVIESFEEPIGWVSLPNSGPEPDTIRLSPGAAHSGEYGVTFSWDRSSGGIPRGLIIPQGPYPLPAIGGPMFYRGQQVRLRSGKQLVPVVIRDVVSYFPSLDPSAQPFLLVSLEDYREYIRSIPFGMFNFPGELWVSLADTADRADTIGSMREGLPSFPILRVYDSDARVEMALRYPLAGGGWDGITIISITTMTIAVVLALGTYAIGSVRLGRVDLTVIRVIGLSRGQLFMSLALERTVVAVLGIAAGTALGLWLGQWVLGMLGTTSLGRSVVPPMIVTVQGWIIALVFTALIGSLLMGIILAALAARKLNTPDVLKMGE